MNSAKLLAAAAALGLCALPSVAAPLTPDDGANHIGQITTVCGVVALTNFDADTRFWPTFLYVDISPIRISSSPRSSMVPTETSSGHRGPCCKEKRVCVTGIGRECRGKPEITLSDASQLTR
jgi:hypothetical protein